MFQHLQYEMDSTIQNPMEWMKPTTIQVIQLLEVELNI